MAQRYIEFLKQEDFNTAKENGSVEINGETLTYSEENLYLVPDETQEQIADLQAEQAVQSAKITAVEESVKKYYRHRIDIVESNDGHIVEFDIINSKATAYTSLKELADDYSYGAYAITANYLGTTGEYSGAVSFVFWGESVLVIGSTYSGNVVYNLYYEDGEYGPSINVASFYDYVYEL